MTRIGWRLVLEPTAAGVAWSLMWDDGAGTDVEAGLHADPTEWEEIVGSLVPTSGAADLWDGPLADWEREYAAAQVLGESLLPRRLREGLLQPGTEHTVTVATRGWCAAVPWDTLVIDETGTRLLERCTVLTEPHLLAAQPVDRKGLRSAGGGGGLAVVDPGPVAGPEHSVRPLYPGDVPRFLHETLNQDPLDVVARGRRGSRAVSVADLSDLLRSRPWDRLLFAGHVRPGAADNPTRVALVLSRGREPDFLTAYDWLGDPAAWPVPRRVALIGCGSGDGRPPEDAGLPLAALLAGADLVTATRWPVPTDLSETQHTFARLVSMVQRAHRQSDPVAYLRDWQITELYRWRLTHDPAHAPLIWAALVNLERVPRQVTGGSQRER